MKLLIIAVCITMLLLSCGRAPKPKTETVVEEIVGEDYFLAATDRLKEDKEEEENEQKRYDITNAVTFAIIALMLAQY